jgi:hypothetical protein
VLDLKKKLTSYQFKYENMLDKKNLKREINILFSETFFVSHQIIKKRQKQNWEHNRYVISVVVYSLKCFVNKGMQTSEIMVFQNNIKTTMKERSFSQSLLDTLKLTNE